MTDTVTLEITEATLLLAYAAYTIGTKHEVGTLSAAEIFAMAVKEMGEVDEVIYETD